MRVRKPDKAVLIMTFAAFTALSLASKPAHAAALSCPIAPSTSPTGFFHVPLSGTFDDTGWAWAINITLDGGLVYTEHHPSTTGTVIVSLDLEVGALINGSSALNPTYGPLTGTHTCELTLFTPAGTVFDTGPFTHTF